MANEKDCTACPPALKLVDIDRRVTKLESICDSGRSRIEELERGGDGISYKMTTILETVDFIKKEIEKQNVRIEKQTTKPDFFIDWLIKLGTKILEYGVLGGLIYIILKNGGL
jgi:uncharacterized coiled-coil DUF342 family protein